MGYQRTHLALATAAVGDRFVVSVDMKVGAYLVANAGAMPTDGARHVTATRTVVGAADTPGTLVVVGKNLAGEAITETLTVGAHAAVVASTKWFASVTSVTGAGWVIAEANDTIVVGCGAEVIVVEGTGTLHAVVVNTTAAGAVTLADRAGTIAILKSNIVEHTYEFDATFYGWLQVTLAAASDITVLHTGNMPFTYAMS